jgi:putative ABC transport system permease protein
MIGAGLLIKSFVRLKGVDPGFDSRNVLTVALALPSAKYPGMPKRVAFHQAAIERLQNLAGVEAVGATNNVPMSAREAMGFAFTIEGKPAPEKFEDRVAIYNVVNSGYFRSLNIPVLEGRVFTDADARDSQPVVIINDTLARRHWPEESPIGKKLKLPADKQPREVVGVIATVKRSGLESAADQETFVPYLQSFVAITGLVIRTQGDPASMVGAIQGEMKSLDPDLPLYDIKTMEERLSESVAKRRFTLLLLGLFAAIALLLAAIGIYGVMSYSVAQRTHEIGIRMALGGQARDMLRLVIKQGMALTLVGVAIGLVAAFALTRLIESFLFGVSATDPATFTVVSLVLAAVAFAACFVPARRATKVDPMEALRHE